MNIVEYIQNCIAVYEKTLKAMGLYPPDTISQTIDNSQLSYVHRLQINGLRDTEMIPLDTEMIPLGLTVYPFEE